MSYYKKSHSHKPQRGKGSYSRDWELCDDDLLEIKEKTMSNELGNDLEEILDNDYDTAKRMWADAKGNLRGFDLAWRARNIEKAGPVTAYGLKKVEGGYQVCRFQIEGRQVNDVEFSDAEPKNFALDRMKTMIVMDIVAEINQK